MKSPKLKTTLALSVTALLLAGCGDHVAPTAAGAPGPVAAGSASTSADPATVAASERVARAFALALSRTDVRVHVRNAMRASPVTQHKLVLQEFVLTPAGRHMVEAAAKATGTIPEAVLADVRSLPPMDFYAPYRQHRRTWRATEDVLVGTFLSDEQPAMNLYATDGGATRYFQGDPVPGRPVLFIRPAERKSPRVNAQPNTPGDVIQDANDGELSGTYEWVGRDGKVHTVALAALRSRSNAKVGTTTGTTTLMMSSSCDSESALQYCSEEGGGGSSGGGTSAPADTTLLGGFEHDVFDGWGDTPELEFRSSYRLNGEVLDSRTLRIEGSRAGEYHSSHQPLIFQRLAQGSPYYIRINMVETDWLDDDDLGSRNFYYSDNYEMRSIVDNGSLIQPQTVISLALIWRPVFP